ncbi:MAG: hypothetical protein KJZ68_06845 [Phycisphaerales bacterium]|nr:hypothetical protein [Phycisphaerales bacterium]
MMESTASSLGYRDGEGIPDSRIREVFRQPPEIPPAFNRSALLVGPHGAGKTVLFRFHKVVHDEAGGTALHINLVQDTASISQRDGIGPWTVDIPSDLQRQIAGKTSSLLAISIAERLSLKKRLKIPPTWLDTCLPPSLTSSSQSGSDNLAALQHQVTRAPLRVFDSVFDTRPLGLFLARLAGELERAGAPLLLLFDRADLVTAPALFPVLDLLNQTFHYRALLATRPGHPSRPFVQPTFGGAPGDHYDVWQLGSHPRSPEWAAFARAALEAQFGDPYAALPSSHVDAILAFSGGSCRNAVELVANLVASSRTGDGELLDALDAKHRNENNRVRTALMHHGLDYSSTLSMIRRRVQEESGAPCARPVLHVDRQVPATLWAAATSADAFFDDALRTGALNVAEPQEWLPGARPSAFEVPISLLWTKKHGLDSMLDLREVPIHMKERELLTVSVRATSPPRVFTAYRMNIDASREFRGYFQSRVSRHPELHNIIVLDGRGVPAGADWASVIRKRIRNSNLVVADMTGLRGDVVFEVGFAFGLRKVLVPVILGKGQIKELPAWLRSRQIIPCQESQDLDTLVSTVHSYLLNPSLAPQAKPSRPSPGLAIWYPAADWSAEIQEQFRFAASQESLNAERITPDTPDSIVIKQATSASLLGVGLDGTTSDALVHYLCGAIVAAPRAGQGGTLTRRILIATRNGSDPSELVAESLANCQEVSLLKDAASVRHHVQQFGRQYRQWRDRRKRK